MLIVGFPYLLKKARAQLLSALRGFLMAIWTPSMGAMQPAMMPRVKLEKPSAHLRSLDVSPRRAAATASPTPSQRT